MRRSNRWLAFCLAFWLLLPAPARAVTDRVELHAGQPSLALLAHMQRLPDLGGALAAQQLLGSSGWQPLAWHEQEQQRITTLLVAIALLAYTGLAVLVYSWPRRDPALLSMGLWVVSFCLYELAYRGYPYPYGPLTDGRQFAALPLLASLCTVLCMGSFFYYVLQLHAQRFWRWLCRLLVVVYLAMLAFAALGELSVATRWSHGLNVATLLTLPVLLILRWRHRQPHTMALLGAAGILYAVMLERVMGLPDRLPAFLGDNVATAYLLLLSFIALLLSGLWQRSLTNARRRRRRHKQLLARQKAKQEQLQATITQQARDVRLAMQEAREAMQAKSDFLARISHDLRAPLTSILGYAQLITEQESPSASRKASIIRKSAKRLLDLLNDLIDYAANERNLQALLPRPVYTYSFLNSVADEIKQLAAINHNRFVCSTGPQLPALLLFDHRRMHQILVNVLTNACKFTRNGQITLHADFAAQEAHKGDLLLTITDTGCGIEDAQLERIFEPFIQLEAGRQQSGLGLGLAIVKQWVERMHGQITIKSSPGMGTEVRLAFTLPVVAEQKLRSLELGLVPQRPHAPGLQDRSIWLIEDSAPVLELLTQLFNSNGFSHVRGFACGKDLHAALAEPACLSPDLVITDFYLPDGTGSQIAHTLRQRWHNLPIILLSSGMNNTQTLAAGLFDEVILKSMEWSELTEALLSVCQRLLDSLPQEDNTAPVNRVSAPNTGSKPTAPALSELQYRQLLDMLEVHAVSDITRWAGQLQEQQPGQALIYARIRELARSADLSALKAFVDSLAPAER